MAIAFLLLIFFWFIYHTIHEGIQNYDNTQQWKKWSIGSGHPTYLDYSTNKMRDTRTGEVVTEMYGIDKNNNHYKYYKTKDGRIMSAHYIDSHLKNTPVDFSKD